MSVKDAERQRRERLAYVEAFDRAWQDWQVDGEPVYRPADWQRSLMRFHEEGLPIEAVLGFVDQAIGAVRPYHAFRYFAGCCWTRIREGRAP